MNLFKDLSKPSLSVHALLMAVGFLLLPGLWETVGFSQDLGTRQTPPEKAVNGAKPAGGNPLGIQQGVLPDVILMRNEAGEEILVPKVRYEEFEQFLQRQAAIQAVGDASSDLTSSPSSSSTSGKENLERIEISIAIDGNLGRLKVEADARLREPNTQWKSIPIGLGLTQIVPSAGVVETESIFPSVRISNENTGYEWLISPGTELNRRLAFDSLCNMVANAQTQSIRLDLPSTPTLLKLNLPIAQWDLTVTGSGSEVVEPFREIQSMSQALVRASGGTIVLSWTKKMAQERIQAIEVLSQTKFVPTLDDQVFRASSSMVMRGPKALGGRRFLITLPKNCQWLNPAASVVPIQGYRISKADSDSSPAGDTTTLTLDFEESFSRTETELAIEWQQSVLVESQSVSFSIPKMEGVQRHTGAMELVVPKGIRFVWEPQPGILFVKQSGGAGDASSYEFRFEQQSVPLLASWISSDQRSSFRATYEIMQDRDTIRMVGSIDFVELAQAFPFFQFDTKGWVVERLQVQPTGKFIDISSNRASTTSDSSLDEETLSSISLSLSDLLPVSLAPNSVGANNTSANNTSVNNASANNASVNNGSTNNGSTNNGSTNNGSTNNASANNASANNASANNASANNASANNASVNNASANNASVNNASANNASVNNASVNNAAAGNLGMMPEVIKTVPPSDGDLDSINGVTMRALEQEKARESSMGISFVLSRPFPLRAGESVPFQLAMPTLSWLDSQTQVRKSLCPQGDLLVKSSYTHFHFDLDKSSGLSPIPSGVRTVPRTVPRTGQLATDQPVQKIQINGSDTWIELSGSVQQASSIIAAVADTSLLLGQETMEINQAWNLQVQGPIPRSFLLSVPSDWVEEDSEMDNALQVFLEETPVRWERLEASQTPGWVTPEVVGVSQQALVRIVVPDRLGAMRASEPGVGLQVMKKTKRVGEALTSSFDFQSHLPFLWVDNTNDFLSIQRFSGEIRFPSDFVVRLLEPRTSSGVKTQEVVNGLSVLPFDCTGEEPMVRGSVLLDLGQQDRSIQVESAWLQSISNAVERRERLVLRFQTQASAIALVFPAERRSNSKVILNGAKAKVVEDQMNPDRLEILLPPKKQSALAKDMEYVLEVFTWPTAHSDWVVALKPDFPSIENSKHDFPVMWQIIVPASSHLIGSSDGLSPGYSWSWRDLWSNRLSDLDQVALESQMAATSQPLVSQNTNQYLFYGLSQTSPMQVWLAPRYLLWVPVALCILFGTVAVMELRWLQHPWLAILVLAIGLGFTMWDWDFAAAIVQCMILAIGIAFLYSGLRWLVDRQTRRRTIFTSKPVPSTSTSKSGTATLSGSSPKIPSQNGNGSESRRHLPTVDQQPALQAKQSTSATTTAPTILANPSETT